MPLYASIDQGNTATKLTLWRDTQAVERIVSKDFAADRLAAALARHGSLDGAVYCSVRGRDDAHWQALLAACPHAMELTHATPLPIALNYATPHTLGLDRIAAAAGAVAAYPGRRCLVAYKSFAHEVVVGDDAEIEQRRDGAGTAAREEHEAVGRQQAAVMA